MAAERAPVSPREWVGKAAFPWPALSELAGGAPVVACYCVVGAQQDLTRAGKPYYRLQLSDRYGLVEARVWDPVTEIMARVRPGGFVGVRGRLEVFNGARQVKVNEIAPVEVAADDLELFLPRSARDPEEMAAELAAAIASVADAGLRNLLARLLDPGSETGRAFARAPAAKLNHHAYIGGLLEHTLSITRACSLLAEHYGPAIDRDLLVAGALLHDLGKIREIGTQVGFPYTDEGKLLGHILLGLQLVADAARAVPELGEERLLLLQHLIASHQGRYEWQSPREPRILEALLLHYCDDLDAKMNQAAALLRTVAGGWTAHDRAFGRELLQHRGAVPCPGAAGERDDQGPSPEIQNGQPPRRRVRFAGKMAHEPKAAEAPPADRTPPAPPPPAQERSGSAPEAAEASPEALPEALPPRRVAPPDDVLPPDPHSLDLFS